MYTIYRIEHKKDGMGPYFDGDDSVYLNSSRKTIFSFYGHTNIHQKDPEHPGVYADFGDYVKDDEFCAFPSKDLVNKWFTKEELEYLFSNGYKLKKYKVKEIRIGKSGKQCLFKK